LLLPRMDSGNKWGNQSEVGPRWEELLPRLGLGSRLGPPQPQGYPIRGTWSGPSGGTSTGWGQGGRNCCCQDWNQGISGAISQKWSQGGRICCQGWTWEVNRGLHKSWGHPLRGPRAGPSGRTCQWWAQAGKSCCQDWVLGVDRGSHSRRGHTLRGPGAGPRGRTSQRWGQGGRSCCCQDWFQAISGPISQKSGQGGRSCCQG